MRKGVTRASCAVEWLAIPYVDDMVFKFSISCLYWISEPDIISHTGFYQWLMMGEHAKKSKTANKGSEIVARMGPENVGKGGRRDTADHQRSGE